MTDPLSAFEVGQTVKLQDGRVATVRYLGDAHFAAGDWVGLELETATGKNNGEVHGESYFDCKPLYGMFVRPAAIRAFGQSSTNTNGGVQGNGQAQKPPKPAATALKRQSIVGSLASRSALNAASPTPSVRSSAGSRSSLSRVSGTRRPSSTPDADLVPCQVAHQTLSAYTLVPHQPSDGRCHRPLSSRCQQSNVNGPPRSPSSENRSASHGWPSAYQLSLGTGLATTLDAVTSASGDEKTEYDERRRRGQPQRLGHREERVSSMLT